MSECVSVSVCVTGPAECSRGCFGGRRARMCGSPPLNMTLFDHVVERGLFYLVTSVPSDSRERGMQCRRIAYVNICIHVPYLTVTALRLKNLACSVCDLDAISTVGKQRAGTKGPRAYYGMSQSITLV